MGLVLAGIIIAVCAAGVGFLVAQERGETAEAPGAIEEERSASNQASAPPVTTPSAANSGGTQPGGTQSGGTQPPGANPAAVGQPAVVVAATTDAEPPTSDAEPHLSDED